MTELDDPARWPELDAEQERALELQLRHAVAPVPIDPARHERLLAAALLDPFAEASDEERAESERLRRALAGDGDHPSTSLALALAAAYRPPQARLPLARDTAMPTPARQGKLLPHRFAALGASLALAAAVLFMLVRPLDAPRAAAPELSALALAQSRSTAPLFVGVEPSRASTRIDRIASARARDLRDNRFAAWGVR